MESALKLMPMTQFPYSRHFATETQENKAQKKEPIMVRRAQPHQVPWLHNKNETSGQSLAIAKAGGNQAEFARHSRLVILCPYLPASYGHQPSSYINVCASHSLAFPEK
jgi:hypothetical protein